jgi:hypothetical protein
MLGDEGCLICGKTTEEVPVGVYAEYPGEGARHGERVWLCEACAQTKDYARAFVLQVRAHYASYASAHSSLEEDTKQVYGYGYRIASPILRAQVGEHGSNRFHEWTEDI